MWEGIGGKEKFKEIVKGSNDVFERNYNDWRIKNLIFLQLKVNKLKQNVQRNQLHINKMWERNSGKECRKGVWERNAGLSTLSFGSSRLRMVPQF